MPAKKAADAAAKPAAKSPDAKPAVAKPKSVKVPKAASPPADQDGRIAQLAQQVQHLAAALDNAEARLKEMGIADALTGLYSYRYFLGRVAEEVARADRFNLEVSCIMVGLDRISFEGMLEVARMIKDQCRVYDIPARWGQNELVMLLPATDIDGALTFAERLRLSVEARFAEHAAIAGLTVSIGVSSYPTPGVEDAQGLVEAADTAVYKATQQGGNRTVVRS